MVHTRGRVRVSFPPVPSDPSLEHRAQLADRFPVLGAIGELHFEPPNSGLDDLVRVAERCGGGGGGGMGELRERDKVRFGGSQRREKRGSGRGSVPDER
jgi:hypothetical protein